VRLRARAWLRKGLERELTAVPGVLTPTSPGNIFMSLVNLVLILVAVGVVLWLVNTYVPMDGKIKGILNAVVVIGVVVWLLQVFGLMSTLTNIHIGK
jgi:type IV secretory pathway TrbD component